MRTLDDINSDLSGIAGELGLTGAVAEALVSLLSNSIYLNEVYGVNTVLEASPSRCTTLNSAIKHAYDLQYSVPRGTNQRFIFTNIRPLKSKSVKKYDLMGKVGNYNLYYAQDYNLVEGIVPSKIEAILGTSTVTETLLDKHLVYLSSNNINISESIALFVNGIEVPYTSVFRDFGVDSNGDYFIITDTDYSVDVYYKEPLLTGNIYSIKYIPYLDASIDANIITTLPDFNLTKSTITTTDRIIRLSSNEVIMFNSMVYKRSNYVIRSKTDIENLVRAYFPTEIRGVNVVINSTPTEEHPSGVIYVYYLMENLELSISDERVEEFNEAVKKAYYVQEDIIFLHATPVDIDPSLYKIHLLIHYSSMLTPDNIINIATSYSYNIGQDFNTYAMMAELTKSISEINYIDIVTDDPDSTAIIKHELAENEYMPVANLLEVEYESVSST